MYIGGEPRLDAGKWMLVKRMLRVLISGSKFITKLKEALCEQNVQKRRVIGMLNGILLNRSIAKENKKQIYSTIVKSITT